MPLVPVPGATTASPGGVRPAGARLRRVSAIAAAGVAAVSLQAQALAPEVAVEAGLTATDNGNLAASGREGADLITVVRPKFALSRRGPRLEFDLAAAASLVAYANGTQKSEVRPELRGFLRTELVERWLYVDAAAEVEQAEVSSYGTPADDLSGVNQRTATSFRASPYLLRDLSPTSYVLARHDVASTNNGAETGARLLSNRTLVRYERKPVPVGAGVEVSRLDNDTSGPDASRLTLDTARATGSVAFANQLVLGAVAGLDRSDLADRTHTDPLYGVTLLWNPWPRTSLAASVEHRFFGASGSIVLRHRTPFMSFLVSLHRGPATVSSALGQVDAELDLRPFLDAILTTRNPDPMVRRGLVQSLVGTRALDVRLPSAIDVVAGYPQLASSARATWVFLSPRNTAALTLYRQTLRQLTRDDDPPLVAGADNDSRRAGASFQFSRRLTPQLSADAIVRWSKITGLAARAGESSQERVHRLAVSRTLSPRTGISAGVRHSRFSSNARGEHGYNATLAFVGLRHSF
jgi:uncharacterized protein (PEP-CTERM system associated)